MARIRLGADKFIEGQNPAAALNDGSITTAKLADDGVTTAKLAADAVTGAKLADNSVDSEHYVDGSIDTAHIGDAQVTATKIGSGAATDGQVLTADGAGGVAWEDVAAGGGAVTLLSMKHRAADGNSTGAINFIIPERWRDKTSIKVVGWAGLGGAGLDETLTVLFGSLSGGTIDTDTSVTLVAPATPAAVDVAFDMPVIGSYPASTIFYMSLSSDSSGLNTDVVIVAE